MPISCTDRVESCARMAPPLAWVSIRVLAPVKITIANLQTGKPKPLLRAQLLNVAALPAVIRKAPLIALRKCSRRMKEISTQSFAHCGGRQG